MLIALKRILDPNMVTLWPDLDFSLSNIRAGSGLAPDQPDNHRAEDGHGRAHRPERPWRLFERHRHHALDAVGKQGVERTLDYHDQANSGDQIIHLRMLPDGVNRKPRRRCGGFRRSTSCYSLPRRQDHRKSGKTQNPATTPWWSRHWSKPRDRPASSDRRQRSRRPCQMLRRTP